MTKSKTIPFYAAIIPVIFLILALSTTIIVFKQTPHIPLVLSAGVAVLVAYIYNYKWEVLQGFMIHGITMALVPVLILLLIGVMIGTWIVGGVVPAMIYYGLQLLSPKIFLLATLFYLFNCIIRNRF